MSEQPAGILIQDLCDTHGYSHHQLYHSNPSPPLIVMYHKRAPVGYQNDGKIQMKRTCQELVLFKGHECIHS